MIDNILGNKTNILVLRFLTKFKNQFFSSDEIAKEVKAGLRNVYDALNILNYEGIIKKEFRNRKNHYKFIPDTYIKEIIDNLFEEERKRIPIQNMQYYKIISEIESEIVKLVGNNLIEIILFGSIAKGRDTINSDIDLCVLINKDDQKIRQNIKKVAFNNKFDKEIQIHVFTSEEFINGKKSKNQLIENILKDGLSLKIGR